MPCHGDVSYGSIVWKIAGLLLACFVHNSNISHACLTIGKFLAPLFPDTPNNCATLQVKKKIPLYRCSMFELHISYNPRWLNLKEVLSYFKFVLKTLTPALRTTPRATLWTTQWTTLVLSTCNKTSTMALSLGQECMRNGEICTIPRRTSTHQMEEIA